MPATREAIRERYRTDEEYRERKKRQSREYLRTHPEYRAKVNARKKDRQQNDHAYRHRHLSEALKKRVGITLNEKNAMIEAQGGLCLSCGAELLLLEPKRRHVDHNHTTGRIRAILCHHCNVALGHADDSPEWLRKLADYVEKQNLLDTEKTGA